nr:hypothetical protein [Actinoplanes polyasparticus]
MPTWTTAATVRAASAARGYARRITSGAHMPTTTATAHGSR